MYVGVMKSLYEIVFGAGFPITIVQDTSVWRSWVGGTCISNIKYSAKLPVLWDKINLSVVFQYFNLDLKSE